MLYATGEAEPGAPPPTWRTALQMPPDALSVPAEWRPSLSAVHVTRVASCHTFVVVSKASRPQALGRLLPALTRPASAGSSSGRPPASASLGQIGRGVLA